MPEASGDLLKLIENLQEAQRKIVDATGGKVDAVLVSPAGPVLLPAAQQQLLRNEAEYRQFAAEKAAILDALPAHIALLDPDGMILTVNKAWRDFATADGFSGKDFAVGLNYLSACETTKQDNMPLTKEVARSLRAVLGSGAGSFSVEYSCKDASARRWFQFLGSPMPAQSGYGAVVMHVDIGDRKIAEANTQEMKERLETLVNAATVGILVHHDWKPIMANDALARMFGHAAKDAILALEDLRVLFAPEEHARIAEYHAARHAAGSAPGYYHVKARRQDGTPIELENRAFALDWGDRKVVGAMITDITQQRSNEGQLRQLQKMEAVGQLTGGIAHDFNNILMVILSNVDEILEERDLSPTTRQRLEQIGKVSERANDLTRSLLAFSRKLPLNPQPTDVNELVVNIGDMLRRTLGAQIEIDSVLTDDLWPVNVDIAQLQSVLVNLCINARDAMPGGGRLLIETANVELDQEGNEHGAEHAAGSYVRLTVTDTGSGISSENLRKVFEPFFTTKEVGKGTGLGLSMVYGFVRQSGGHVSIYSEEGMGTAIKVYLPRHQGAGIKEARTAAPMLRGVERVLVVEDDALVCAAVVQQLQSLGYDVDWAVDGAAGLNALETAQRPYNLLLTDVLMPGPLSGKGLADAVVQRWPGVRLLFMSGYSGDAIARDGLLNLGVELLQKPFRKVDLAAAIRRRLDGPTAARAPSDELMNTARRNSS
jgi:PAS domain S-box-containing protein